MSSTALPKGSSLSRGRFELPVLAPLDSLTAGTNIPPPPDSPIEEAPPPPPSKSETETVTAEADGAPVNGHATGVNGTTEYIGRGRTNGPSVPTSPISQHRPSSIRRFLSRKSLHSNYTNEGTNTNNSQENLSMGGLRPESPSVYSTTSKAPSKRRSGSWFRRFLRVEDEERDHKRTSVVYEEKASTGPPPPKLPELDQLQSRVEANDEGSLGADDMFKNIK